MHRAEPKAGGYFGDIQLPFTYEPAGGVYLHAAEVIQHTASCFRGEHALKLCPADKVVTAYLLYGEGLVKPLLKVFYYGTGALCGGGTPWGRAAAPPYKADKQLLKGGLQQLLAAEGYVLIALHGVGGGVVEGGGEYRPALAHYVGKQRPLFRPKGGYMAGEKLHCLIVAFKAYHHKVWGGNAVCAEGVKLAGAVEYHLAPGKVVLGFPCCHFYAALIHIHKLPEIMSLPRKGVIAGKFEIMNCVQPADPEGRAQSYRNIGHEKLLKVCIIRDSTEIII